MMRVLFCGDVMVGGRLPYNEGGRYITSEMMEYLHSFDILAGTLECAIGTGIEMDPAKMSTTKSIIYARDEDFFRILDMGFDVLSLANNHATDLGKEGLRNTIRLLDENHIKHCGAGMNLSEARQPAVITKDNMSIAIIGCLFSGVSPTIFHVATDTDYGVYQTTIEQIEDQIREVKACYDKVVIMPHWGEEYTYLPPLYCKSYARRMIEAGADLIIGDHPHIINPVVKFNNVSCYFSLGNFLFPDRFLEVPRPTFYPDVNSNFNSIKRVWSYPKTVDEPILSVHRGRNRVGMAVEATFHDKKTTSRYQLVALDENNILKRYKCINEKIKRLRMFVFGLFIRSGRYSLIRRYYNSRKNIFRRAVHKLSDMFQIVYDIDISVD